MHTLTATASSSLSLPPDNYIYSIAASAPGTFSAISSDDSLRVFDAASLSHVSLVTGKTHEGGVSSMRTYGGGNQPLLATGGQDGKVRLWDSRNANSPAVVEMQTGAFLCSIFMQISRSGSRCWATDPDSTQGVRGCLSWT